MVHLFRKYQQPLMILITVLIIITFVWFWNGSQSGRLERSGTDTIAIIYGHHVSDTEAQREGRKFYVALELGMIDLVQDLAGFDRNQAVDNFVWNSMVLRREADRLQIVPTDEEVKAALVALRPLQTDGQFDPNKLNELVQRALTPRGFSDTVIDDLLRDELRLKKMKELVASGVEVTPAEFQSAYDQEHQKMEISVLRFNNVDFAKGLQISDDDAKKAFEPRHDQFKSDEQRKVKFVSFELTEAEKKLTGRDRNNALAKLASRANDFTQAMLEKDAQLDAVAAKFAVPVTATGEFTQATPDPRLANVPALAAAAFKLTKDDPNSDVIQGENGFSILHLEDIVPSRPLTFDEAKPKIVEQLKTERANESLKLKASEVRTRLQADLKAGKSWTDAALGAGQHVENIPPFSLAEPAPAETADQQQITEKAVALGENQLSEFVPTEAGGLLVYLQKRLPVDPAQFAKEAAMLEPAFAQQKRSTAFREWLRVQRDAAKLQITQHS